jgi:hypothetical protein
MEEEKMGEKKKQKMFELYLKSAENTTRFSIYLHTSSGIE